MVSREARPARQALHRLAALLVPLLLLASTLVGFAPQTASASHTQTVPTPSLAAPAPALHDDTTPTWTFSRPEGSVVDGTPLYQNGETTTVTMTYEYGTQCLFGGAPVDATFPAAPVTGPLPSCGVHLGGTSYATEQTAGADGGYELAARTVERTTKTTVVEYDDPTRTPSSSDEVSVAYSDAQVAGYTLDTVDPTATVSTSPTAGGASSVTWALSGSDSSGRAVTLACALVPPAPGTSTPVACAAPSVTTTLDREGVWTLRVTPTDAAGNTGTTVSATYDRQLPPVDPGVVGPTSPGNVTPVTWQFTKPSDATASCRLTGPGTDVTTPGCGTPSATGPEGAHTFSTALPGGDGVYTLEVTLTDAGGSSTGAASYELDTTGPTEVPTVTANQSGTGQVSPLTWTISTLSGVTTRCRLVVDGTTGEDEPCAGSFSTVPLDGSRYAAEAVYVDGVGNHSAWSVAGPAYTYDVTAPSLAITSLLPGPTGNDPTPVWTFAAEDGATVTCRVGAPGTTGQGTACSGTAAHTVDLGNPGDGDHELTVTATDAGGLTTERRSTYRLDRVAPAAPTVTHAAGGPTSPSQTTTVTWVVAGDGDAVRTECRLDKDGVPGTWEDCTSPVSRTLSVDGSYVLRARQYDAATNMTDEGASTAFVVDNTPPAAPVVTGSSGESQDPTATWRISHGSPAGTRFECRLVTDGVGGAFGPCTDPYRTTFAADGTYRIDVHAYDAAGNRSALTAGPTYRYDTAGPAAPAVSVTPTTGNVTSATWTVVPAGDSASTQCRLVRTAADGAVTVAFDWRACSTYAFPLDQGDGAYALSVRSLDLAGNVGAAGSATHVLDTTPPGAPVVVGSRTGTDNERDLSWTFSGEGTATCRLTRGGVTVGTPVVGCTSPYALTLDDVSGTYVLHVAHTDAVGNTGAEGRSADYVLDVTPPATPVVTSDRTGTDNERVVTYAFSGEGTASCQLTGPGAPAGTVTACTSPHVVTLPAVDGTYALQVAYTDAVGNTGTAGASPDYVLDLTAPAAPTVTGPSGTGNAPTVSWDFAGEGTATCTLLSGGAPVGTPIVGCTTGYTQTLPQDGTWSLQVTYTDAVGNQSLPGTSAAYLLDTAAPAAPQLTGPTGPATSRLLAWSVSTDAGTTVACRLVRGATVVRDWTACAGSFSADLTGLPDGGYVAEARATDAATNTSPTAAAAPYVLDSTAPSTPVVTGPAGPSQLRTPAFTWTGEAGARAECRLSRDMVVAGDWVACASGHAPALPSDGTWTLAVRLVDAAGNTSPAGVSGGYLLDTTAPAVPVVTPPASPGRDLAPSWGAVVESASVAECRFTGPDGAAAWAPCTFPHVTPLTGRPDGPYVLEVRTGDAAGNVSGIGSGAYVLDTVSPAAAVVTSPASPGRTRTPSFSFTTEAGASTRCRLTSGTVLVSDFAPCTSPTALDLTGLADGTYVLTVRVTDAAGNPGPAATGAYVLDTTAPAAPVAVLTPATPSSNRVLTWAFTYETGGRLDCRLTLPSGTVRELACASRFTVDLTGLPDGSYGLAVRAVDAAGNAGPATTSVHVLDSAALAAPDVTGPPTPGGTRTPTWTIGGSASTECRLTRGTTVLQDWAACAGSFTADLFGQPEGAYVLAVRARTSAGAVSAATLSRYDLDVAAPAAATLVAPPTPSTNRMPTWSIASPEAGVRAECRVLVFSSVLKDWAPCPVSAAGALHAVDLTGAGDGSYTLVVRLTDAAGNRGPETGSTYVLDTKAPVAVGVTGPPSPGNDPTPTWLLSTAGGAALECRLTSASGIVSDWAPCATEHTADLSGLPDGTYTLSVRAVSASGTPGPETTSAYVLSRALPGAPSALNGPASPARDRAPAWTFTLPSGTTGVCRVVQGTRVVFDGPCASPFVLDLSGAPDGSYTLTVQALDAAGNLGPAATSAYVLDTVPTATPAFTSTPGSPASTLDPQWRFSLSRDATGECRLLAGGTALEDWMPCTGAYTALLAGRPDGEYAVQVRAVDSAGNTSPAVSGRYVLDRTAVPVVEFQSAPATPSLDRTVSWSLSTPEGTSLECRLLAPDATTAWRSCQTAGPALGTAAVGTTGAYALDLTGRPNGTYVLEARVLAPDGRRGAASSATYVLDTVAPGALRFAAVPADAGTAPDPVWLWEAPAEDLVECRLVRGTAQVSGWDACLSPYVADLSRLGEGSYAVELRRTDAAGNVSAVTRAAYRYDLTPPPVPVFLTRPPGTGSDRTVGWAFAVPADATATCTVTRDRTVVRAEAPCTGRYALDLGGLPDGEYVLAVRYTDAAGNTSEPGTGAYRLTTLGVGGPVRVDPPARPQPPVLVDPVRPVAVPLPRPARPPIGPVSTGAQGSTPGPGVPIVSREDDIRRASDRPTAPSSPSQGSAVPEPGKDGSSVLLPGPLPVEDVPEVLRDVVTGTIKRPGLPLALLAIVALFLLAQNRIDRRDPKLASAPVDAEPELDFTTIVRRPGAVT